MQAKCHLRKIVLSATLLTSLWTASAGAAKTLVFCSEGSPEGFNPQFYTSSTTFDASSRQVYNRLVEFDRRNLDILPSLAERWVISPDGLQYTFYLRKGVKFHTIEGFKPSRDFNADDVLFSFNRQRDPNHPYHKVSGGSYEYFNSMGMPDLIKSIDKLDDYTVRFTLNRPEAPFLADLAMDYASILSAEYGDKLLKA
ncbi:MAG TPA: ABC transporter substrate-binding protein, partial [Candidatus Competibacteraceae bacterium]|nr:ABC transporter substrate-binding protein [Candidatus Competibacteraceae bacterium]